MLTIGINVLAAIMGIIDLMRIRPSSQAKGTPVPGYVRGLIIPILIAALMHIDKFDFTGRPDGILYVGAYVVTLILTSGGLWHYRPALRPAAGMAG